MTLLFDINVILDVLLLRQPHAQVSVQLFAALERGSLSGMIPASAVPTLYYLASRSVGAAQARSLVQGLLKLFAVLRSTAPSSRMPCSSRSQTTRMPRSTPPRGTRMRLAS